MFAHGSSSPKFHVALLTRDLLLRFDFSSVKPQMHRDNCAGEGVSDTIATSPFLCVADTREDTGELT